MVVPIKRIETVINDFFEKGDKHFTNFIIDIFCCGCDNHCPECHNKDLWHAEKTDEMDVIEIINEIDKRSNFTKTVRFLGGDFLLYPKEYYEISKELKGMGFTNILYTGKTEEYVKKLNILEYTDVVLYGKYNKVDESKRKQYEGRYKLNDNNN